MIKIYDTKAREKREFVPVNPGKVGMYVCGPTVYNYIHIGNARTFISFDTIRRYLMWRGFEVTFVQNVTDVDDKIITKAKEEGRSAKEVSEEYTAAFIEDMHAAGVLDPDIRPKATGEIDTMIALIEKLIEKDHAYVVDGDVYFSVRSYDAYGELSHRNIDEMESGHRALRKIANMIHLILRFGRRQNQESRVGLLHGAKVVLVGILSAPLCRKSICIFLLIFMAEVPIWHFLITKTNVRSRKRRVIAPLQTTGCMAECCRSTLRKCQSL